MASLAPLVLPRAGGVRSIPPSLQSPVRSLTQRPLLSQFGPGTPRSAPCLGLTLCEPEVATGGPRAYKMFGPSGTSVLVEIKIL